MCEDSSLGDDDCNDKGAIRVDGIVKVESAGGGIAGTSVLADGLLANVLSVLRRGDVCCNLESDPLAECA